MLKRLGVAVPLVLLLAACGPPPEPPPPPPLDPSGTWDITVTAEGMQIFGVLVFQGSPEEGYTGSIDTEMGGAAVSNIQVNDQTVTFYIPDVNGNVELLFDGDTFTGGMSSDMGQAAFLGTRREGG